MAGGRPSWCTGPHRGLLPTLRLQPQSSHHVQMVASLSTHAQDAQGPLDSTCAAVWPGRPRGRGRGGCAPRETLQVKFIHDQISPKPTVQRIPPRGQGDCSGTRAEEDLPGPPAGRSHRAVRFLVRSSLHNRYPAPNSGEPGKLLITGFSSYRERSQRLWEHASGLGQDRMQGREAEQHRTRTAARRS